jgi:hypothetical protein
MATGSTSSAAVLDAENGFRAKRRFQCLLLELRRSAMKRRQKQAAVVDFGADAVKAGCGSLAPLLRVAVA